MTRYFSATNSTRRHAGIAFEPYSQFAGATPGLYSTDNATEIAALLELVADPASGITEITAEEYDQLSKKKAPISNVLRPLNAPSSPQQRVAVKPGVAVVVEEPAPSAHIPPGKVLPSSNEALVVDKVAPPPAPKEADRPKRKAAKH